MYREALAAFNAGANVLTGGGLRAIVEALCKENETSRRKSTRRRVQPRWACATRRWLCASIVSLCERPV